MNPEDMKSAFSGIPMEHNVFLYGVIPVALIVMFVMGILLGNQKNAGRFFAAIGAVGWIWYTWSLVSKYGDKAIGELWADQLAVFFVCVPIILAVCFLVGLMGGSPQPAATRSPRRGKRR